MTNWTNIYILFILRHNSQQYIYFTSQVHSVSDNVYERGEFW